MGRNPRSSDKGLQKGSWTAAEDKILIDFIKAHGEGKWNRVMKETGLKRCGKSCRLRWLNYLRPDIKRGNISSDEEELIIRLHKLLGNRWSLIAGRLPGRTDNEIKNYWNTNLGKKAPDVQLSHFRAFSREPPSKATQSQDHPVPPQSQEPVPVTDPPTSNYSSSGSPSLSLNSTEDHLMDFNLDGEDIRQILESDFSGIIDGLLSPDPELEVDDYLSMLEEHDFQSRCVPSADKTSTNVCLNDDCTIGSSDFETLFEDHGKWPELEDWSDKPPATLL